MKRFLAAAVAVFMIGGLCGSNVRDSKSKTADVLIRFHWYEETNDGKKREFASPAIAANIGEDFNTLTGGKVKWRPKCMDGAIPEFEEDIEWGTFLSGRCEELCEGKYPLNAKLAVSHRAFDEKQPDVRVVIGETLHIRALVSPGKKLKCHCGGLKWCEIEIEKMTTSK